MTRPYIASYSSSVDRTTNASSHLQGDYASVVTGRITMRMGSDSIGGLA